MNRPVFLRVSSVGIFVELPFLVEIISVRVSMMVWVVGRGSVALVMKLGFGFWF